MIPLTSFATQKGDTEPDKTIHIFKHPSLQPNFESSCRPAAIAYAVALTELIDAQQAADEAYRLWYDCEHGGGMQRRHSEISSVGHSILITD